MKRKMSLICCLLALTLLSSIAFLACEKKPAGTTYTEPTAAELELVLDMLETDHKKAFSDATPANYELNTIYVLSPAAAYLQYTVAVDTTGGAKEDDVKVVNSSTDNTCTVEVNSKSKIEVPYTLTVTLVNKKGEAYKKDDGSLYTVSFSHKIPAYTLVTFEEFVKAADDKSEQTVTVVGYLTGIISTSSGSKGSIYLVDKQGYGYYAYGPTGVITDSITNDEQLRAAWPVGTEIEVSGTATCYNGQYEFNKGCTVKKTGNSITQEELYVYRNATADWSKAVDNQDTALIPYQNALVELNNAKMVSEDGKYYYFTVGGKKFNLYNTNYFMDGEDVKTLLEKFTVGKQATIKGLVSVYSKVYQIYPLGLDAISDVMDATFTDQEKFDSTKEELSSKVAEKYTADTVVTLPTAGTAFTDVTIEWALDKDYSGITLNNNVFTITLQETEQKAKLTATLKIGSESTTKDFDISVDAVENIEYEPVIINAPAIGDYKIVMDTTAAGGSVLYFDGTLNSKGALNSTDKASKAVNVTVAAVEGKEGVYTLKVNGKYLVGYLNGTFNNMKLADEPGEWTWNTELKTFVCTFADKDNKLSTFYFGTYVKENVAGNTFALSKITYVTGENANKVGVSQFVGQFATLSEVEYVPVANKTALEGDFVVFMDTTAAGGSVLYFDGTLNSKGALNSTDKASKAVNVTVAAVEGKEGVYTLKVNGKYLVGYLNGTFNNMKLADEPGEWTWNTELKTFVCTFADKDNKLSTFYFGTYVKENVAGNTFALSKITYVTGENANKVGVSQFVGQFGTMQKKSDIAEPTDAEKLAAIIAKMSTEVTADFDLDATATWTVTSGSAIVITNGKAVVTRPAAGEQDATVVLTATLGEATQTVTITVKAIPSTDNYETLTLAEFLAKADSNETFYKISGVVVNVKDTTFGNIYISDGTTVVYVYGLCANQMELTSGKFTNVKDFNTLGVEVGTYITIVSAKGSYNGTAQAVGSGLTDKRAATTEEMAYVYKYQAEETLGKITVTATVANNFVLDKSATWTSDNAAIVISTAEDGTVNATVTRGSEDVVVTLTATVNVSGQTATKTFAVTVQKSGEAALLTETVSIKDYATANSWVNATQYSTLEGKSFKATAKGSTNTGKYYADGNEWRIYQTETPSVKIEAKTGYTIVSVKVTYTSNKTGVLTLNSKNVESGAVVDVNATNVTFSVGNTDSKVKNGQVRITAIEVVYVAA